MFMVIEHVSAGIIPMHHDEESRYLLLKYPQGHWGFPKGHIEDDETLWETAVRELAEETGLSQVERIGESPNVLEYWYQHNGKQHHKEVHFFGGIVDSRDVTLSEEHINFTWVTEDETLDLITFDNERDLFERWLEDRDDTS
jgi:bis(5'-nucleosidyl)-tetraphosphatase